jgi:beta-xylosidase
MRLLLIFMLWSTCAAAQEYHNAIIHADYSDPDAIRVGNDYYMTASSFNVIPGLPILHSKDFVNWQLTGKKRKTTPAGPRNRYR